MNLLHLQSSPYLLQHAHNPVHWQAWSEAAFEQAAAQNKPVLVSIGYSSCHWCHVMEHESFNDEVTASLMNSLFINIKIDREERPDLDAIYMDALQAMTGSGGWPLNIFLTPDKKPFYGGTYFPPKPMHNRASWKDVLVSVHQFYHHQKEELVLQANQLYNHLQNANILSIKNDESANKITANTIDEVVEKLLEKGDKQYGGFGNAPKFPQCSSLLFLLQNYIVTKHQASLEHVTLTLDAMMMGGIYDQLAGGFARYSVDKYWFAPHFEKMLYDNAQLLEVYSLAYSITNNENYKQICTAILNFVQDEMLHNNYLLCSAIDADSEGEEGKFYVFTKNEIENVLQQDSNWFCKYYNITDAGNWEAGRNILFTTKSFKAFCISENLDENIFTQKLNTCKTVLKQYRALREAPFKDTKSICSWNSMMANAIIKAGAWCHNAQWLELGLNISNAILTQFAIDDNRLYHIYHQKKASIEGFAEDYIYTIQLLITAYKHSGEYIYIQNAQKYLNYIQQAFIHNNSYLLSNTSALHTDVLLHKIEIYESSIPNINAVYNQCLQYLNYKNQLQYSSIIQQQLEHIQQGLKNYPTAFATWAQCILSATYTQLNLSLCLNTTNLLHINTPCLNWNWYWEEDIKNIFVLCDSNKCYPPFTNWDKVLDFKNEYCKIEKK